MVPHAVLHVPHASRRIPGDVRATLALTDRELERELDRLTDSFTDELFALDGPEFVSVVHPVSSRELVESQE